MRLKLSMKINLLAVSQLLLVLEVLSSPTTTGSASIINLGYAQYQGSVDTVTNITSFLGIRYAAPPVGDLRWAAPQPPPTVSEVQQATAQPNACYQAPAGNSSTNPFENTSMRKRAISLSEDCLFLNGGHFVRRAPSCRLDSWRRVYFRSRKRIRWDRANCGIESRCHHCLSPVPPRTIWFPSWRSGQRRGCAQCRTAYVIIMDHVDQNYALQWVQAYISGFGGDPTKVTIWGESAGAGSVLQHLVAHGGNTQPPLFSAAMTSSTFLPSQYNYNDRIPEMLYSEVVDGTNCTSSLDTLSCLRAADVNTLQILNYNINVNGFFGVFVFVVVVDGTFILERPTVTISKGRLNGNYLLAVTNSHEGNTFVNQSTTLDIADYVKTLFPNFGSAQAAGAVTMYQDQGSNVNQANLVMGESIFVCPTYYLLKAFGQRAWKGEFAIPAGLHGSDIEYYFTSYQGGPPYNNSQFITAFSNSFMAMVMSNTPDDRYSTGDITPSWTYWRHGSTEMMFNETSEGVPDVYTFTTDKALLERCAYWRNVSAYSVQ